jgi:hypothetical protein
MEPKATHSTKAFTCNKCTHYPIGTERRREASHSHRHARGLNATSDLYQISLRITVLSSGLLVLNGDAGDLKRFQGVLADATLCCQLPPFFNCTELEGGPRPRWSTVIQKSTTTVRPASPALKIPPRVNGCVGRMAH